MNQVMANFRKTAMDCLGPDRVPLKESGLPGPGLYLIRLRQHVGARNRPKWSEASFALTNLHVRCNRFVTLATPPRNTVTQRFVSSE
jgi:hypothetical protein